MAIYKCKMCGGDLLVDESSKICECEYCGTQQTLPRLDNEKKNNLLARADHFRRNNDYDKAQEIYEEILKEDITDAEVYWLIVLCKYGIEYVKDTSTRRRIPTCNRTQYTSIFADEDYKKAIEHANGSQRVVYEKEADEIDKIQKEILKISQTEAPFDVFICYKESDERGNRTKDSVLAQELYFELTNAGFKVFFSRITLEDKLGVAYEPYIFSALNSTKVMVVVGTKEEYFNAVWVRNEWSRFLAMMKNGEKKILIPAYRDMDPYNLPVEFSHLQAQDMSKLGFMQDLVRGISKICAPEEKQVSSVVVAKADVDGPLIKRAYLAIEEGNFEQADVFLEQALNINPENPETYLVKVLVDLKLRKTTSLTSKIEELKNNQNFRKVMRFFSITPNANVDNVLNYIYEDLCKRENGLIEDVDVIQKFINCLSVLAGYKDVDVRCEKLGKKVADISERNTAKKYERLCQREQEIGEDLEKLKELIVAFKELGNYREAEEKAESLLLRIQKLEKAESQEYENIIREQKKKIVKIAIILVSVVIIFVIMSIKIKPMYVYGQAVRAEEDVLLYDALILYEKCGNYKDSVEKTIELKKIISQQLVNNQNDAYDQYSKTKAYIERKTRAEAQGHEFQILYIDKKRGNGKYKVDWCIRDNGGLCEKSLCDIDGRHIYSEKGICGWCGRMR